MGQARRTEAARLSSGACAAVILLERAELLLFKDHGVTRQFRRIDPIRSSQVHFARASSRHRAIPAPSAWPAVWQRRYALATCDRAGASQLWAHRPSLPKIRPQAPRSPRRSATRSRNLPDINGLRKSGVQVVLRPPVRDDRPPDSCPAASNRTFAFRRAYRPPSEIGVRRHLTVGVLACGQT